MPFLFTRADLSNDMENLVDGGAEDSSDFRNLRIYDFSTVAGNNDDTMNTVFENRQPVLRVVVERSNISELTSLKRGILSVLRYAHLYN